VRWLGGMAEELGVEIYPGFAASEVHDILTILCSYCLSYLQSMQHFAFRKLRSLSIV